MSALKEKLGKKIEEWRPRTDKAVKRSRQCKSW